MKSVLQAVARYWRKLDKSLLLAALLCSTLSVLLLYSILPIMSWQKLMMVTILFS